jgi:hypothetical protein
MTSLLFLKVKSAKALKTDKPEHPILKAIIENIQTDRQTSKAIEVTTPQEVAKQRHKHSNQDLDSLNDALSETPPPYPKTPHQLLNLEYTLSLVAATVIVYSWTWRWPRQMVCRDGVTLLTCSLESAAEKTEISKLGASPGMIIRCNLQRNVRLRGLRKKLKSSVEMR